MTITPEIGREIRLTGDYWTALHKAHIYTIRGIDSDGDTYATREDAGYMAYIYNGNPDSYLSKHKDRLWEYVEEEAEIVESLVGIQNDIEGIAAIIQWLYPTAPTPGELAVAILTKYSVTKRED